MRLLRRSFLKTIAAATSFWMAASLAAVPAHAAEKVTVFAAASMKNALDAINAEWAKESGNEATVSYAASSALAKQIEQGAPADIFISADFAWMDYIAEKKLINADSRSNLLGNRIVLVAPADKAKPVEIKQGFDLAALVGDGRLAMGAVDSVPAGKYGKAALEKLGVWSSVEQKVAGAESVRAALLLVSRGEAPMASSTRPMPPPIQVKIVGAFPEDSHPPIIYPVAILSEAKSPAAKAYLDFLKSAKATPFFEKQGFTVLK